MNFIKILDQDCGFRYSRSEKSVFLFFTRYLKSKPELNAE